MGLRSETSEFQGGPGIGETQNIDPNTGGSQAPNTPQPPAQPKTEKIYVGGKVFNSVEELATYASSMEAKVQATEFTPQNLKDANQPKVEDLIFSDPGTYTKIVKEDAMNETLAIIDKREAVRNLWNNFYNTHRDLAEHRDLVEFQYEKLKKEFGNLPADQALVKVGSEVRAMLNKVRGSYQGGRELPTDPAIVAGASNGAAPTQTTTQLVDNDSFITQVKKFQRRGK